MCVYIVYIYIHIFLISLKDIKLYKAIIVSLCYWDYNTCRCHTYDKNIAKDEGGYGAVSEHIGYILLELSQY